MVMKRGSAHHGIDRVHGSLLHRMAWALYYFTARASSVGTRSCLVVSMMRGRSSPIEPPENNDILMSVNRIGRIQ